MKRPNILMIMADQFRNTTLQGMGDEIATPNLAGLMERSTVFTQACCACPLCTPSRAALATGKYPHRCGVPVHDAYLPLEISELIHSLAIYDGRYKWIRNWNDSDELYDLQEDPQELNNLFAPDSPVIARLKQYTFMH